MSVFRLEIEGRPGLPDPLADETSRRAAAWLDLRPRRIQTRKVMHLELDVDADEAQRVLTALTDPVAEVGAVGNLDDPSDGGEAPHVVTVGFLPGVTDGVGRSVHVAVRDCLGRRVEGNVYTSTSYLIWGLDRDDVDRLTAEVLHNPLIQRVRHETVPRAVDLDVPRAGDSTTPEVQTVALRDADDDTLVALSRDGLLALNLLEMRAIAEHYRELGRDPTDAELECLAQTWSEHCKHKIFSSPIDYTDPQGETHRIDSFFKQYVRGTTDAVADARRAEGVDAAGEDFLVSVFHDNAGVVRFTEVDHLVYKVETHNSPSALDPYGGAMTGIVGVNRDSFGTGIGADLLTNVWGYCLGPPDYAEPLPKGLMHPRRIREGVHHGVIDGGNQSGIPYSRGFELFDARYAGKPLVYCGTVAAMPVTSAGRPTHEKRTQAGDAIVMIGGRIGKDGIHGATFSSVELDESSPVQAVQIGDPLTQKMMFDMLTEARERGLISGMTDNGAGGLSSSVGEMAEATGGARIDLARAPVKYPGLAPWQILVSEAQERMTVAVAPDDVEAFMALAESREVEASVLGEFTETGRFEVTYGDMPVADLDLAFLHDGLPRNVQLARWEPPARDPVPDSDLAVALDPDGAAEQLLNMLGRAGVRSNEHLARHYDHEVKGLSVIKPFVGRRSDVPAAGTVMRVRHGRDEGVVLGEGIQPFYSDVDTYEMATASVDEAVRRVLCAGARWDRLSALDNFCWPDPIVSDGNPDGAHKLAQLVRSGQGLRDACEAYGLPLISGKDSMKNDAYLGGVRISIPPTLLISVMGQLPDVRQALDPTPRAEGDQLWLLGGTRAELGCSEFARAHGLWLDDVPRTDLVSGVSRYRAFVEARDSGLIRSAHVVARGGLGVALAHVALAGDCGLEVNLDGAAQPEGLDPITTLFSESTGRMLVTVAPADGTRMAALPGAVRLGSVGGDGGALTLSAGGERLARVSVDALRQAFKGREDDVG